MKRICPNPSAWNSVFEQLTKFAQEHICSPTLPPKPLILAGWVYSNDVEKMQRWNETLSWAEKNGCSDLVEHIVDLDFYFVDEPTTYRTGPMGGPMFQEWNFEEKDRPDENQLSELITLLFSQWKEIVGLEIASITQPLRFSGEKARKLIVLAETDAKPPWGKWIELSDQESARRTFTKFRAAINNAIAPHEVDHIDFVHRDLN